MYRCARWEAAKHKLQHYRRRRPEASSLYQAVYHGRDKLAQVWEERFQATYGVLRQEVLVAFDAYLNCGLVQHGAARVYCDTCKHSLLVAFSCKKRGVCPSCSAKRAVLFAEHLYEQVVNDTPARHVVFTIPKRLRAYPRYDRAVGDILFRAAWSSIKQVLGGAAATPAAVLTLQCSGEALNFHPHLHGCLADGVFLPDGSFKPFEVIDQVKLTTCFAEGVLAGLHAAELIDDDVVSQILSQQHSGFSVWLGEPFQDKDSKRFVARYIERGPISLEKLSIQDDLVIYTTKEGKAHEFDALEFLAALSAQVPKPYESLTRYFGYWSYRARGERMKKAPLSEAHPAEPPGKAGSAWARCIKQVYEINPLECPKCKGAMRVIACLQDPVEIKKIMQSLGLPDFRAPPPLPPPPDSAADELFFDPIPDYDP